MWRPRNLQSAIHTLTLQHHNSTTPQSWPPSNLLPLRRPRPLSRPPCNRPRRSAGRLPEHVIIANRTHPTPRPRHTTNHSQKKEALHRNPAVSFLRKGVKAMHLLGQLHARPLQHAAFFSRPGCPGARRRVAQPPLRPPPEGFFIMSRIPR